MQQKLLVLNEQLTTIKDHLLTIEKCNRVLTPFFVDLRQKIATVPLLSLFADKELKHQIECITSFGLEQFKQFSEFLENL